MKELAPGVHALSAFPIPWAINAYLVGDVLIDAARRQDAKRILKELRGRPVAAHALTHAHADHQGASHRVCSEFGIPFWVEGDVETAENPSLMRDSMPDHPIPKLFYKLMAGPGHPVDRPLREGDEVAGFEVLETPGHSRGHVCLWRESDRVLIVGDVFNNQDPLLAIPGLRMPKDFFTPDPALNRQSAKRLGPLEPKLVLFGHGRPLRDTRRFVEFCEKL